MMEIVDGKIILYDDEGNKLSYEIEQITAEFEEDILDVIGVVRCKRITIESNAPSDINSKAEKEIYNEFADIEYNDSDGDGWYRKEAINEISTRTGVDMSQIEIEWFQAINDKLELSIQTDDEI